MRKRLVAHREAGMSASQTEPPNDRLLDASPTHPSAPDCPPSYDDSGCEWGCAGGGDECPERLMSSSRNNATAGGNATCAQMAMEFVRRAVSCAGESGNFTESLCSRLLCAGGGGCGSETAAAISGGTGCSGEEGCRLWNESGRGCGPLEEACRVAFGELECEGGRGKLPSSTSYEWWYLLVVVPVVAGAVGNVLVCLAVAKDRRLHNVTNYFLTSLAIADLLVSLFVMPLGAIPGFLGHWPFGAVWCNVYVTCDVLACSSSIMHMCFVSVGRCIGIRHPLRSRLFDRRLTALKIAAAWLLSGAISSSITVLGAHDTTNIMPSQYECTINNRAFFALGSLFAFYVPMVVMVVSYSLTVHLLRRQKAEFAEAAAGTPPTGHRLPLTPCRDRLQRSSAQQQRRVRLQRSAGAKRKEVVGRSVRRCAEDPLLPGGRAQETAGRRGGGGSCGGETGTEESCGDGGTRSPDCEAGEARNFRLRFHAGASTLGLNRFLSGRRRRSLAAATAVATEQKASKVLGLVFSTFVLCWAPFFLLNVAMAVSSREPNGNPKPIFDSLAPLTLWLGYVSSTINPLIYTAFNRTFRAAFLRLLRCNCAPASASGSGRRVPARSPLSLLSSPEAAFSASNTGTGCSNWEESTTISSSFRMWEESEAGGRGGCSWGRDTARREDWAHTMSFDEAEEALSRQPSISAGRSTPETDRGGNNRSEQDIRNGLSVTQERKESSMELERGTNGEKR